jgi:hypothetical protein
MFGIRSIRRVVPMGLVLAGLCLSSGCLSLDFALSDPRSSQVDPELIGVWREDAPDPDFLFVTAVSADGVPAGVMSLAQSNLSPGARHPTVVMAAHQFFVTDLNGVRYVNIADGDLSTQAGFEAWKGGVTLKRYAVINGFLHVWEGDDRLLAQLKKDGTVTDAASLTRYLASGGDAALFPDAHQITYARVG